MQKLVLLLIVVLVATVRAIDVTSCEDQSSLEEEIRTNVATNAADIAALEATNATHYVASITFTNGWTITSVSTGLVFTAP